MKEAQIVVSSVDSTVKHLRKVSRVTAEVAHTPKSSVLLASKNRITYVKVKKGESCGQTVLSDCEKYNVVRSELMSLVDALQQLPSHKFYETFVDLRATITSLKVKWGLDQGTAPDTYESHDDMEDMYSQPQPEPDTDPEVEQILNRYART
ncbi:hypothetical protein PI124_g16544 [Phytophthora idaei]|nr:hypothetical protein PI125_g13678 [Phytophthora idaei]KAG3145605.1 hypothetical protein PI126_g13665 [Phytophthora idaei]KAG3238499.1 hypothetical protein PI124_g16544 [Phytophthora idaei]